MVQLQQFDDRNCYESDKDDYGMIEVKTCMDGTEEVCCLSKGETGTQRTGVINWRSHMSTVEIRIRSLNEDISFITDEEEEQSSHKYTKEANVAPSEWGNINEYQFRVPLKRESGATSMNETIRLSMTIDTEQAVEDSREGPTLYSKIQFI
jgi:hypothetical protein